MRKTRINDKSNDIVKLIDHEMIPWYIAQGMLYSAIFIPIADELFNRYYFMPFTMKPMPIPLLVLLAIMLIIGEYITINRVIGKVNRSENSDF